MKAAIIYATRHGCTDKCAHTLANEIVPTPAIINLNTVDVKNVTSYDTIILGGSIHAGTVSKKLKKFIDKNQKVLLNKKIGLFICCLFEGDTAQKQFENTYPEGLRNSASAIGIFGGELDFEKMNFFEKTIVKKVANIEQSVSRINYPSIKNFASKFNES